MSPRRLALLAAFVVMAASGAYVFIYLYRWEWNRALVSGVIFLAAEIGLLGALILDRVATVGHRLDELDRGPRPADERVLRRLQENAQEPAKPFAWMTRSQTNVFVPVLFGAGVVLSALAWVVDRVARATAGPAMEKGLARTLTALQPLPGGMLGDPPTDPFRPR
jgi:hypothetical protein